MTLLPRPARAAVAAVAAVAMATALPAAAQTTAEESAVRSVAELMPPGVLAQFSLPNVDALRERYQGSPMYGLYTDESLAPVRERLLPEIEKASEKMEEAVGFGIWDILELPTGQVSAAIVQPPGETIGLALVIDHGVGTDGEETVDQIVEVLETQAKKNGGEILSESVGGTDLITIIMEEEPQVPTSILSLNHFRRDGAWVIATNLDLLSAINDRWDSSSDPTFAEDDAYAEIQSQLDLGLGRDPAMTYFFDPIGLLKAGVNTAAQLSPEAAQAQALLAIFPLLGVENLKGIGQATDFNDETGGYVSSTFVRLDRTGAPSVYDLFAMASGNNEPPVFVADDATAYQSLNWQPQKAFESFQTYYDQFLGGPGTLANQLDQLANAPDGPGVHIKDDVLDQITGRVVVTADTTGRAEQIAQRQLISLELTKSSTLPETIARVIEQMGTDVDQRDFRGTTIYQFDLPSQSPLGAQNGESQTAGLAAAGGYMHFATNVSLLEQSLRGVESGLAGSEMYQSMTEGFPRATLWMAVQNGAAQMEQVWELARTGGLDASIENEELQAIARDLPPFDEVREYFGRSAGYAIRTDDGVLIKSFSTVED